MGVKSYLMAFLDHRESHYHNTSMLSFHCVLSSEGQVALSLTKSDLMPDTLSWTLGGSKLLR